MKPIPFDKLEVGKKYRIEKGPGWLPRYLPPGDYTISALHATAPWFKVKEDTVDRWRDGNDGNYHFYPAEPITPEESKCETCKHTCKTNTGVCVNGAYSPLDIPATDMQDGDEGVITKSNWWDGRTVRCTKGGTYIICISGEDGNVPCSPIDDFVWKGVRVRITKRADKKALGVDVAKGSDYGARIIGKWYTWPPPEKVQVIDLPTHQKEKPTMKKARTIWKLYKLAAMLWFAPVVFRVIRPWAVTLYEMVRPLVVKLALLVWTRSGLADLQLSGDTWGVICGVAVGLVIAGGVLCLRCRANNKHPLRWLLDKI